MLVLTQFLILRFLSFNIVHNGCIYSLCLFSRFSGINTIDYIFLLPKALHCRRHTKEKIVMLHPNIFSSGHFLKKFIIS
jgi:hypothetical protein